MAAPRGCAGSRGQKRLSMSRRRTNRIVAVLAVLAGVLVRAAPAAASAGALRPPPPAAASVEWSANAERPWNQEWANYSCQDGTRVQEVTSPVAEGQHAYRIELRDGDNSYGERCELGMGNPTRNGFPL